MTQAAETAARTGGASGSRSENLEAAYRHCERIAREHYENFPVASLLLSREARRALSAVYAFARGADDLADENYGAQGPTPEQRLAALDAWQRALDDRLLEAALDERLGEAPARDPSDADTIALAVADVIRNFAMPVQPFHDLLSAFRQDVTVHAYASRDDLLDYCRRSANPVGRIVLGIHRVNDARSVAASDAICTGLQLANFWQDVGIDRRKGRIYLPRADRERLGVEPSDLDASATPERLRRLILEETRWTREFFGAGRPLLRDAPGRLRLHLRLVWNGGMRILERIEGSQGDVLAHRPKLGAADWVRVLLRSALAGGTA